ncbi:ABC transporter permease [Mucilaginibacter daejeonensis]|uniref:ABC transporter permease n=1 Tax=Mucilaginibacter daejeonensis TaxID=398049 RepID=UPI001D179C4B|nr:ABC transporter permease [Mucilaginibacter daejeonensis]UEG54578.1 ABC transporter permease [Mucilaginibacter daejeonensis]
MLKNHFKTAFRSLLKNKAFTLINIIGLAIGISAAIVIYLVVQYDLSFDKFHADGDRIYRVVGQLDLKGQVAYNSGVEAPLGQAIRKTVPGIELSAPFYIYGPNVTVKIPQPSKESAVLRKQNQIMITDGSYFDLFQYKWLAGSAKTAFDQPDRVVLTESRAKLYFPTLSYTDVIGKQVIYADTLRATVSGIVQDLKENTDLTFHDFISFATAYRDRDPIAYYDANSWNSTYSSHQLFIRLDPKASPDAIAKKIKAVYLGHSKGEWSNSQSFNLQPLSDVHFNANYDNFDQRLANKKVLYGLLGIGAFLLLLACINFINLSTAQSVQRAKEIGIRKTIGGTRGQLISQFLTETLLLTVAATILSVFMVNILLKLFVSFIPPGVTYASMFTLPVFIFIVLLVIAITLLSGLYPAVVMSRYQPVQIIKGQAVITTGKGNKQYLRKGLTVAQFVIAQIFVMGTLLVAGQMRYLLRKDLGFKKDAVLTIETPRTHPQGATASVLLNKIRQLPQVANVSLGSAAPSSKGSMSTLMKYMDGKKEIESRVFLKYGDDNYFKLYGFKLVAGRPLQNSDSSSAIIINETYAHELGFQDPARAVGKSVFSNANDKQVQIIGVVHDFHALSLHAGIMPLALVCSTDPNYNRVIHVALRSDADQSTKWSTAIAQMQKDWKMLYPEQEFEYNFVDDSVARFYEAEQNTGKLLNWATGLSVLISCLGLLGLAIYTTNQRTKEIGVRKVMGATVTQIVSLLSMDMVKLIVLAFVIAMPIAWYAMNQWLQNFAYHTTINIWLFVGTIVITVGIAVLTMSFQTVKAAVANPVKSLRNE